MLRKNATPHAQEQRAHDVTEILLARIDSLMKQEKQKIDETCMNIGRQYVQLHSADYEESFGDQMRAIAVSNEAIAGYDMQVLLITGAATCPKCGHNAPKGSKFCNQCGTPIPAIPYERYDQCRSCGAYVEKGQSHCLVCGAPVVKAEEKKVQCPRCKELLGKAEKFCPACGLPLAEMSNPVTEQPKEKTCPKCGTMVPLDMHFCTECGTKL